MWAFLNSTGCNLMTGIITNIEFQTVCQDIHCMAIILKTHME